MSGLLDPGRQLVRQGARWGVNHALPRGLMGAAARRGDLEGRLVMQRGTSGPAELRGLIREIQAKGPLHGSKIGFVTADHATVREVLTSNDFRAGVEVGATSGPLGRVGRWAADRTMIGPLNPPSLLVTEPPAHTRYRKLVSRVFTVRAVERLRTRAELVATELLDGLDASSPAELVEAYCSRLPVTLIAEILGVPAADHGRVLAFGSAAAPSLDVGLDWAEFRRVERSLRAFEAWLDDHLEGLRERPGDDLMSQLVLAREDGVGLTPMELKATAGLILAAGFETTVNLLGNGIALLHEYPAQLARLRAGPSLWPTAVDEVLRFDPPVLLTGRLALRDTEVSGVRVPRGSFATTLLAGANRDPEVFADPDRFDVGRANARDHVSFSSGRHYCLGAALARMEGEVGLRAIFERYPDLRLLPGARRRTTRILRGYAVLPARLG